MSIRKTGSMKGRGKSSIWLTLCQNLTGFRVSGGRAGIKLVLRSVSEGFHKAAGNYRKGVIFTGASKLQFYEAIFGFVTRLGFGTFVSIAESDADNHFITIAETEFLLDGLYCRAGRIFR